VSVRTIDRSGGTILHTSRTNPAKVKPNEVPAFLRAQAPGDGPFDLTSHVLRVLEHQGLDVLIPIGGDDTLSYGLRMHQENVPVIAIPKTMDNDVHGTDYCIGFSTAVTRGVEFIQNLRTSTGSHERIAVVELFGRYSGETSLITAYLAGVDRAVISEVPFDVDHLAELLVRDRRDNPSRYAMMTISEGATPKDGAMILSGEEDAYGHRKLGGIGALTSELLKERTGLGTIYQQLGYLMRSGSPDSLDLMVATNYAVMAADLALEGATGRMVALRGGTYTSVPISVTKEGVKRVDVDELYDAQAYRPKVRHVTGKPMFLY
jgi:6-phosphofructokinase 1